MNDFIASLGPISSAVWGWLIIAVFMHFLWMWQKKTGRAGFVDVAWSIGTGLMAMGFCVVGSGHPQRRIVLGVLMGLWGLRLAVHLWKRLAREGEDGRYESYRQEHGQQKADRFYMIFFQFQGHFCTHFRQPNSRRCVYSTKHRDPAFRLFGYWDLDFGSCWRNIGR